MFITALFTLFARAFKFWLVVYNWPPLTASVLVPEEMSPAATFVSLTAAVCVVPPSVTMSRADESYATTSGLPAMPLLTMLLTTLVTLARLPATLATLLATFATFWFV
ncbi:hypothetical protein LMG28727_06403 [Paraburkholderia kirstenboschensis]|nr:hypothetical protein LMG28727_06403 [Paraburkholderia kirstenboschensis]